MYSPLEELQPINFSNSEKDHPKVIFWTQIGFIFAGFAEGMIGGFIPTVWTSCRESPKILGIANAFACGVFLAIGLCHMTPENIEGWNKLQEGKAKIFPLPEVLMFLGYTILLLVDKVMFDAHAYFDNLDPAHGHQDPAIRRMSETMMDAVGKSEQMAAEGDIAGSREMLKQGQEASLKSYLNNHD